MAIQYDPRLQGKPNTTDILTGQEDLSQQPQDGSQAPPQAAQPQGNAQAAQPQQNAPQSNLATNKPKASSGMFTNVRQYVEKNQPATQNMAGSATKQFTNTADIIKKQMGTSLNRYNQNLQNKQQELEKLRQTGQSQVDQIVNAPAPQQTIQPTPEMANNATGGVRTGGMAGAGVQRPTLISEEVKTAAQKDYLGDRYDQYRKDMDEALSNFVPGDDESLSNLSKVEESYGLTGNWFDPYKDRKFDYRNNIFEDQKPQAPSFYEIGNMASEIGRSASGINLDPQVTAAERLKRQSDAVNSEQGRMQILRDVFGQNRQYTGGAQILDNLLLSSNQQAADSFSSGIRQAGESAYSDVVGGKTQADKALDDLKYGALGLGEGLEDYRQQAITGLQSNINANRKKFVADRKAAIQKELDDAIAGITNLQESQAGGAFKDLSSLAQVLNPYTNRGYDFDSAFKAGAITDTGDFYSDRVKIDADAFDQLARDYNLAELGINTDDIRNKFFEGSKKAGTNKRSRRFKASSAQAALDMLNQRLSGINAEEFARQKLEEQYGTDLDTLLSGTDLQEGQYYSMNQNEVDRINKLKELQREQDLLQTRDYLDTDEVSSFDAFDKIINKYK